MADTNDKHQALIARLRNTFEQEAEEGLDLAEARLLEMDRSGALDDEAINEVFRSIHSIKGGSGTFGYNKLIDFAHQMETLLDRLRAGKRRLDADCTEVLLRSTDQVRAILVEESGGAPADQEETMALTARLIALIGDEAPVEAAVEAEAPTTSRWAVSFVPNADLMQTGNDPVTLLAELDALGEVEIEVDTERVPAFATLNPEELYLSWRARVSGPTSEAPIREVFDWVELDAEIGVEPVAVEVEATAPEAEVATEAEAPAATPEVAAASPESNRAVSREPTSIRVATDKVDALINLVGELVITQSMLGEVQKDFTMQKLDALQAGLAQLERNTRELQEGVMRIRMLPISFVFNRFPRIVRDLSRRLGKKVELRMTGEGTELDKTMLERIADPLVHILRNALDHGLETPEARVASGKNEEGIVHLHAYHQGGSIHIRISDDGAGLNTARIRDRALERGLIDPKQSLSDAELFDLLFMPGFSTAKEISDVSGRGVGLDVVRKNINALGGHIDVSSEPGAGTTFTMRLPLTLSILEGQLVSVGDETYIIPLVAIVESLQLQPNRIKTIAGGSELYRLRDEYIPILRLYSEFGVAAQSTSLEEGLLVVVDSGGRRAGLFVDDLLEQQQVVIKSLETNFHAVTGLSGATILGNGRVALILDVAGLISTARSTTQKLSKGPQRAA